MKYQVQQGDTLERIAERCYGDARRYRAIAAANDIGEPGHVSVGQTLDIPYVTYRHRIEPGDTTHALARRYYGDPALGGIFAVLRERHGSPLHAGDWLLVPDVSSAAGYTVRRGESLALLAARWFGQERLWPIIAIANRLSRATPPPDTVITRPRLNWRCTVSHGDTVAQLTIRRYGDGPPQRMRRLTRMVAGANLIDAETPPAVGQVLYFPSFDPWD